MILAHSRERKIYSLSLGLYSPLILSTESIEEMQEKAFEDSEHQEEIIEDVSINIEEQVVDKVIVHDKAVRYSRTANQKNEIYYRDIGYLADSAKEIDIAELHYDFIISKTGELVCVNDDLQQIVA